VAPHLARREGAASKERSRMPAIKGNRSKRKTSNRSKVKRATAKSKRVLSIKRKRRAKKSR
jgi:hypothetical protein